MFIILHNCNISVTCNTTFYYKKNIYSKQEIEQYLDFKTTFHFYFMTILEYRYID